MKLRQKKIIILSIFLGLSLTTNALLPLINHTIPGGIVVIDLPKSLTIKPQVLFGKTPVYVQKKQQHYQALLGIPLLTKTGTKNISVITQSHNQTVDFWLKSHQYPTQYITFKGDKKKYIDSPKYPIKRIVSEKKVLTKARKTYSKKTYAKGFFTRPATGIITGVFGSRRFYNNQPKRPHTGIDYANKIHSPITAPAAGRVILTGDFFFNGKAVFLDHGQGLISAFIHLDKILVKQGQVLTKGQLLGKMGKSGRATGVHLHWSVYLNTTAVNPELLLKQNNGKNTH